MVLSKESAVAGQRFLCELTASSRPWFPAGSADHADCHSAAAKAESRYARDKTITVLAARSVARCMSLTK